METLNQCIIQFKVKFDNMTEPLDQNNNIEYTQKKRHGCVTPFVILMILFNMTVPFFYIILKTFYLHNEESTFSIQPILLGIFVIINLVSAFMLLEWKKLGFYGFVLSSIGILLMVSLLGLKEIIAIVAVIGGLLLYGLLRLRTKSGHSTWDVLD